MAMLIGLSQDREYGPGAMSRSGGAAPGPGKRTLTEALGPGEPVAKVPSSPEGGGRGGDAGAAGNGAAGNEEIGELTADRVGADPCEGDDVGPDVPVRDPEAGKQDIAAAAQQLPAEG